MPIYGKKTTEPLDCALCANLFAQQTQFLASGCSVFSWPPSLILMAEEGWGEKEICTKGVINGQKIRRGAHSNSKSNMASRVNDRQLITLARPNKTPALQERFLTTSTEQKQVNMASMCLWEITFELRVGVSFVGLTPLHLHTTLNETIYVTKACILAITNIGCVCKFFKTICPR